MKRERIVLLIVLVLIVSAAIILSSGNSYSETKKSDFKYTGTRYFHGYHYFFARGEDITRGL